MIEPLADGALLLLRAPLALAACIAAALVAAPVVRWPVAAAVVAAVAALVAIPAPPSWHASAAAGLVAALGLVAVTRRQPPLPATWLLLAVAGIAAGWAAELPWATRPEIVGAAALVFTVTALAGIVVRQVLARTVLARIGMAVAGAWIAVLALLMLLLRLAGKT